MKSESKGIVSVTAKHLTRALGLPVESIIEDVWQTNSDKESDCFTMRVRGVGSPVGEGAYHYRLNISDYSLESAKRVQAYVNKLFDDCGLSDYDVEQIAKIIAGST